MCGRFVATTPTDVLAAMFDVEEITEDAPDPSYNVAPTDPVPAIAESKDGSRRLGRFRWGLVPSWSKDASGAARMINARVETLATKPAFRNALARRRCLLPADGFYEWHRRPDGTKQAWFIARADGTPMVFAGLWEVWRPESEPVLPARSGSSIASGDPLAALGRSGPETPLLRTCSIITVPANAMMEPIHDRMPAVLEPDVWDAWVRRATAEPDELIPLLRPADEDVLTRRPVGRAVNDVRNNGPELLSPVEPEPAAPVALKLL